MRPDWGPIGLILATPLTICLVVLGCHVDRLKVVRRPTAADPSKPDHHSPAYQRPVRRRASRLGSGRRGGGWHGRIYSGRCILPSSQPMPSATIAVA
jgi:hypothetical protein